AREGGHPDVVASTAGSLDSRLRGNDGCEGLRPSSGLAGATGPSFSFRHARGGGHPDVVASAAGSLDSRLRRNEGGVVAAVAGLGGLVWGAVLLPSGPWRRVHPALSFVMPAKAGIQTLWPQRRVHWIPAFAGMTG